MAEIESEIASLLIPVKGRPLLLPNVAVAEIISFRGLESSDDGESWLLGHIQWRDQNVPVVSYETFNDQGESHIGTDTQLAIINSSSGKIAFYAIVVQGIPRLLRISSEDFEEEVSNTGPAESMKVSIAGELASIPDLEKIEESLAA